jgi:hypothetical protein
MVSTTTEDVGGPEELLPQHEPGQGVGERHRAQTQGPVGVGDDASVEPEIAADDEIETRCRAVFEIGQPVGELLAGARPPALVERHRRPAGFEDPGKGAGFFAQRATRVVSAAPRHGSDHPILRRPPLGDPTSIGLHLIVAGGGAATPDPDDPDLHRSAVGGTGWSIPRAASSILGASPQRASSA